MSTQAQAQAHTVHHYHSEFVCAEVPFILASALPEAALIICAISNYSMGIVSATARIHKPFDVAIFCDIDVPSTAAAYASAAMVALSFPSILFSLSFSLLYSFLFFPFQCGPSSSFRVSLASLRLFTALHCQQFLGLSFFCSPLMRKAKGGGKEPKRMHPLK